MMICKYYQYYYYYYVISLSNNTLNDSHVQMKHMVKNSPVVVLIKLISTIFFSSRFSPRHACGSQSRADLDRHSPSSPLPQLIKLICVIPWDSLSGSNCFILKFSLNICGEDQTNGIIWDMTNRHEPTIENGWLLNPQSI